MPVELLMRQFTVVEYNRMIEAGILTNYDRVELIKGEIIQMAAKTANIKNMPLIKPTLSWRIACRNYRLMLFGDKSIQPFGDRNFKLYLNSCANCVARY